MNGSAPYRSRTGSHSEEVRNDRPNSSMAGREPRYISHTITAMMARTRNAKSLVMFLNARSPGLVLFRRSAPAVTPAGGRGGLAPPPPDHPTPPREAPPI